MSQERTSALLMAGLSGPPDCARPVHGGPCCDADSAQ